MPLSRRLTLAAALAVVAALATTTDGRSLLQEGGAQPLAEAGGWAAAAPAAAPASAPAGPLAPITSCTVTAASNVNKTESDPSAHPVAQPQQGPMFVPDAFLGTALLTIHAPEAAGSAAVVDVTPASGHVPGSGPAATDPAALAAAASPPTLRLTTTLMANGSGDVSYPARSFANDLTPRAVSVNGVPCAIVQAAAGVPPSPPPTEESIPGLASFIAERPLTTKGASIIGVDGKPLIVKGINWFGYENGQTNPDGLWGNVGNALVADFVNVVWRMQLLGFNTVRLPFSFQQFESASPKDPKYGMCNPADDGSVAASVTPPGVSAPSPSSIPRPRAPVKGRVRTDAKYCNEYIPNDSLRNRFFWAMRYIAANGFYVIIDDHLAYDTTVLDNPDKWVTSWKGLAADIAKDPLLRNRVMLDLLNEPDSRGIKWVSGHPGGYGAEKLYLRAMDAIHAVHPSALMLVEGTGQLGTVAMNWGDGFAAQPAVVRAGGVEDARGFFAALATKPYANNVVISPHLYPPTISTHREPEVVTGPGLRKRLDNSFGYLSTTGFCAPGVAGGCKKFPVVIGETGSKFTDPLDTQMMADFADNLRRLKAGVVYWCWNANSGDTGGIVKDDWISVNWEKVAWMQKAVGLHPWALGASNAPINPGASGGGGSSQYNANPSFNQGGNNNNNNNNNGGCWDESPRGADGAAFSCQQQKDWGKCGEGWMTAAGAPAHGWCAKTCGPVLI